MQLRWYFGAALATLLALLMLVCRLYALPVLPVDETRYLSVAWEMFQSGDWLVPQFNGEPYSHKPPLMFWLINLAWQFFGSTDSVSLLVVPCFGMATFWLLAKLIVRIDADADAEAKEAAVWAPLILVSMGLWLAYQTLTMFDMLVTVALLLALHGWISSLSDAPSRIAPWLTGMALGLGFIAKGPVILLYWVPLALMLLRLISSELSQMQKWQRFGLATLLGTLLILLWAIPAAISGGAEYARAIFWGQSAGRMANSFAHARPWYWYLMLLPAITLPWSLVWRWPRPSAVQLTPLRQLVLAGTIPVWIVFSLISGKQPHYVLPTLPFIAMGLATLLPRWQACREWGYLVLLVIFAIALLLLPELAHKPFPEAELSQWVRLFAVIPLGLAFWLYKRPQRIALVIAFPLAFFTLLLAIAPALRLYYDIRPMAEQISAKQRSELAVAFVGLYHNQFRYLGRGELPLTVLEEQEVEQWYQQHPHGVALFTEKKPPQAWLDGADFKQIYRGKMLLMLNEQTWRKGKS